jgi:hypothetical protein
MYECKIGHRVVRLRNADAQDLRGIHALYTRNDSDEVYERLVSIEEKVRRRYALTYDQIIDLVEALEHS